MTRKPLTKESIKDRVSVDSNGCWLWKGAIKKTNNGKGLPYGWVTLNGKQMNAHRASWFLHYGEIPTGMFVCHKCDVPQCVNPDHLFIGSSRENMLDMWRKNRHPPVTNGVVGSHSAKLTITQLREIREELKTGATQLSIAKKYGITQSAISRINTGDNWSRYE